MTIKVLKPGLATTVQDLGRPGYYHIGIPLSGGMDRHALAAAKDVGMDMSRLEKDLNSPEVKATMEENFKLAEALGLNGTPSYVIGTDVVVGAIGLPALQEKISTARCGKASC